MLSRADIDAVWGLMKASERVGVVGATLHNAETVQEFVDACRAQKVLFGDVLKRLESKNG